MLCTGCRGLPLLVVGGETPARAKNGQWQPETGMGFQAASKSMISMPCTNVFDRQPAAYRAAVLPADLPKVAVEAGVSDGWYKYVGLNGKVVGLDRFGESAPADELFKLFGFTVENVVAAVKAVL